MQYPTRALTRFSLFTAVTTAAVTLGTFIIAFLTPPLSGPFCQGPCFEYPYTDIASRFPRDYFWMYPAMLISLLFVALMACVYEYADAGKKLFARIGMAFATISAAVLITDYFMQVTMIQPSLLSGEREGIALFTQFNPHGVFIAMEEAGYLLMTIAFLSIAPVFFHKSNLEKALGITFIAGFLLAVLSLVFVTVKHGIMREYVFEVMIISIVWFELIISSVLLSLVFRKALKH